MQCKICRTENNSCFSSYILRKYNVEYYHCSNCSFLQTEEPYWLDESYSRPINLTDTGYMVRNLFFKKRLTILLYCLFGCTGKFLDYAGGYGVFVRLMRDVGFDFQWYDKYTENLFASGFEWDGKTKVDAITLFEVFEHFVNPLDEVEKLFRVTDTIIFSTELYPNNKPKPKQWWYFGLEHGQHISFYTKDTLNYLADKYDAQYLTLGTLHILTKKKVSKFNLYLTTLSRIGLNKLIELRIDSKVWSDYQLACNEKENENRI